MAGPSPLASRATISNINSRNDFASPTVQPTKSTHVLCADRSQMNGDGYDQESTVAATGTMDGTGWLEARYRYAN